MASFTTFTERVDIFARTSLAYGLLFMLFMFGIIAIPFPLTGVIKAPLFLIGVYYWSIYRPSLLPVWSVFLAGCAMDLLSGLPVGMNALIFVAVQWAVSRQRRFLTGQSFLMVWTGFGAVSILSIFIQWLIFGLTQLQWPSIGVFFASTLFGIFVFPAVCIILHMTHKILPMPNSVMQSRAPG